MHGKGGISTRLVQGFCGRADSHSGLPSLSEDLHVFATRDVHANTIGVVAADSSEQHIEGGYWLVWIKCKSYRIRPRAARPALYGRDRGGLVDGEGSMV